jgi:hypothetical protein
MSIVDLRDRIERMSKSQHVELARILIREHHVNYDENQNGIFINMTELSASTIDHIKKFSQYIDLQEERISHVEREMNGLKDTFFKSE